MSSLGRVNSQLIILPKEMGLEEISLAFGVAGNFNVSETLKLLVKVKTGEREVALHAYLCYLEYGALGKILQLSFLRPFVSKKKWRQNYSFYFSLEEESECRLNPTKKYSRLLLSLNDWDSEGGSLMALAYRPKWIEKDANSTFEILKGRFLEALEGFLNSKQ